MVKRVLFYRINDDEYTEERYGECQDRDLPQQACLSDALCGQEHRHRAGLVMLYSPE